MIKNITGILLLLICGFLQAQVTFDAHDLATIAKADQDAHAGQLIGRAAETTNNYDVKWYRCRWNIDPNIKEISGDVTTLFKPVQQGLDSLLFDMSDSLTVDSVTWHNQPVLWQHAANLLVVHFPGFIPVTVDDSVTVFYHGVPQETGFGSFEKGIHNGIPVIWTLSQPYGSSDWWPCKNGLTDKADSLDIYIQTPSEYSAASNGILVSESQVGPKTLFHWKHRYPIATYLVCLAVTNYATYTQHVPFGGDTLDMVNFVYPEDSAAAVPQTAAVVQMIQLFDTLFGIYPFQNEKYGHAQFGVGGGMEHQTMTFVNSFGFELLAHELAHQWFGDMVTCGSWTDIWLNEGFATYLSGLCYERLEPEWWQVFREVRIKSIVSSPGGSVYCPDTTSVSRIFDGRLSYAKGAMILHQLRWIFGDSTFFAAVTDYLYDSHVNHGFSRTADLKSHLENSSGQDLTWYFDDWFTGEGYPEYNIQWWQTGANIFFTVNQTQSHPTVSFFEMLIPVQFKNAERDTIILVFNTFNGQTYSAEIPFSVDSVIFDPDWQLISGNNTTGSINERMEDEFLQISPNPVCNKLTITCTQQLPGTVRIDMLNTRGEMVVGLMNGMWPRDEDQRSFLISQPAGLYIIRLNENGRDHFRKIIVINSK